MKQANFETYKPKEGEFAIAQSRSANPFKLYIPKPHPFIKRLEEFRALKSLWTSSKPVGGK